jgi:hypothetical protein
MSTILCVDILLVIFEFSLKNEPRHRSAKFGNYHALMLQVLCDTVDLGSAAPVSKTNVRSSSCCNQVCVSKVRDTDPGFS